MCEESVHSYISHFYYLVFKPPNVDLQAFNLIAL